MKNLTNAQIEQVKSIHSWNATKFHGNRKKIEQLPVECFNEIVLKKALRELARTSRPYKTNVQLVRSLIAHSIGSMGTNYFKVMIEGDSGIYYASPVYGHGDYNKTRLFDKNANTLQLMELFNSYINRKKSQSC